MKRAELGEVDETGDVDRAIGEPGCPWGSRGKESPGFRVRTGVEHALHSGRWPVAASLPLDDATGPSRGPLVAHPVHGRRMAGRIRGAAGRGYGQAHLRLRPPRQV